MRSPSKLSSPFVAHPLFALGILIFMLLSASVFRSSSAASAPILDTTTFSGPLRVHPNNPRYFTDDSGQPVLLTGSHFWLNLQDGVRPDPPPPFDYSAYLAFLEAHNHNFFRLWTWEQARWTAESNDVYFFTPHPYLRPGPDLALDGKPRFDLTQFNQAYFDRLRARVIEAGEHGMYVSVMLFNGWSTENKGLGGQPWSGHPFNVNNNINGIQGDPNGDQAGKEIHSLQIPAVTTLQEAYVKKVLDTLNDLDNVLYEISNESHDASQAWQYHLITFIKNYEATLPKQHPVGMTVEWPGGNNSELYNSPADWISPNGDLNNPPVADGAKVILADTDHLCGICGSRIWVWKSFTRGENPLFMDQYDDSYKLNGGGYNPNNPNDVSLRQNMGYVRTYANRVNLAAMTPRGDLTSTGYALANPVAVGAEYLVFSPNGGSFTVNLSAASGILTVEWFDPEFGTTHAGGTTTGGGNRSFAAPFSGDAVLYLYGDSNVTPTTTPSPTATGNATNTVVPTATSRRSTATSTPTATATATSTFTSTPSPVAQLPPSLPALRRAPHGPRRPFPQPGAKMQTPPRSYATISTKTFGLPRVKGWKSPENGQAKLLQTQDVLT